MNVLAAAAAALLAALPFPAPKQIPVTEAVKCDWGTVLAVNDPQGTLLVRTAAGPVSYLAGLDTQVIAADGRPLGAVSVLRPGQQVRLYYVLENGSRVSEINVVQ